MSVATAAVLLICAMWIFTRTDKVDCFSLVLMLSYWALALWWTKLGLI